MFVRLEACERDEHAEWFIIIIYNDIGSAGSSGREDTRCAAAAEARVVCRSKKMKELRCASYESPHDMRITLHILVQRTTHRVYQSAGNVRDEVRRVPYIKH